MGTIEECAKIYKNLIDKKYIFTLENNIKFTLFFTAENFYHLLGLEKLSDIAQFKNLSPRKIYKDILSGKITQQIIQNSKHFNLIADRINFFYTINSLLDIQKSNKIIVDFDHTKLNFRSKLNNTKYILYRREDENVCHLTIGKQDKLYPETFMVEKSNIYLSEQTMLDILDIEVVLHRKHRPN